MNEENITIELEPQEAAVLMQILDKLATKMEAPKEEESSGEEVIATEEMGPEASQLQDEIIGMSKYR